MANDSGGGCLGIIVIAAIIIAIISVIIMLALYVAGFVAGAGILYGGAQAIKNYVKSFKQNVYESNVITEG